MEDDRLTHDPAGAGDAHPRGHTRTAKVPPLNYTQLRLLAECAVGITQEDVDFYFRMNGELELHERKQDGKERGLEDYVVVVPAFDPAKYPANTVRLKTGPKPPVDPAVELKAGVADAMFWSDAAVQKFVFPYVASCAGTGAATALQQLQQAWNFYPVDQVAVYALVHVNRFGPNIPLTLDKAFWVVFQEVSGGVGVPPLKTLPLDEFLARYPGTAPVGDPEPERVDYHRGTSHREPQHPDYVLLRALAEWACSIRSHPAWFRFRAGEYGFTGPYRHLPHVHPGDIVVPALTPTVPEGRLELEGVWFNPGGDGVDTNLAPTGDAVFWSTGAIEQFLYPYYASKGGLEALKSLVRMAYVWTGQVPDVGGSLEADFSLAGAGDELAVGDGVFGLIHLYTSEWVEETRKGETMVEEEGASGSRRLHTRVDPELEMGAIRADGSVTPLRQFRESLAAR